MLTLPHSVEEDVFFLKTNRSRKEEVGSERALTSEDEAWVVPLLVVSGVTVTVVLVYQVVVVCRASQSSPSRRHLFLSQALLLGLLLGSSLGFVHSLEQTAPTCVAIRLGTGLSYVLIYSSLLVKQVFLISLNTGVYLPAMYQALLFGFCVLVQLVMGVQWVVLVPSCQYTTSDHITSLSYIIFLLIFISCLAIKTVHIKDNQHESRHIAVLMLVTVIVWLAWMLGASLLPEEQQSAVVGESSDPQDHHHHHHHHLPHHGSHQLRPSADKHSRGSFRELLCGGNGSDFIPDAGH